VKLEKSGLCFSGFDDADEVHAFELPSHPFFTGTLFQPERARWTVKPLR
jgi:CTP synthase (UTP-ammonia lyase)